MKAREEPPQNSRPLQEAQGSGLAEVLQALDDETLRKIFKKAPALALNNLRYDEDEAAVDQSASEGRRDDSADERVDTSVKDLSII